MQNTFIFQIPVVIIIYIFSGISATSFTFIFTVSEVPVLILTDDYCLCIKCDLRVFLRSFQYDSIGNKTSWSLCDDKLVLVLLLKAD